jgi:hypothetical protein
MPDATERKALAFCAFVAGCIAMAPMEFVSGGFLLLTSLLLILGHLWISGREDALLRLLDAWVPPPSAKAEAAAAAPAEASAPEASAPEAVVTSEAPLGTE